jgi:hypothetical protein
MGIVRRVSYPLVGSLLVLAGAVVGTFEVGSATSIWTFALGLALLLVTVGALISRRPVDRLRAVGFAGIATIIAAVGTMNVAEVGGDTRVQLTSLALVDRGTLVVLAAPPDPGIERTRTQRRVA